jgi:hypothetical protein
MQLTQKCTTLAGGDVEVSSSNTQASRKRKPTVEDSKEAKPTSLVPKERAVIKKQRPVLQVLRFSVTIYVSEEMKNIIIYYEQRCSTGCWILG